MADPFAADVGAPWPEAASGVCQISGCGTEGTVRRPLLPCDACGLGVHRDCAGMSGKAYSWNRGFVCEVCRVTRLDKTWEMRTDLHVYSRWDRDARRKLMRAASAIRARAWADGSWGSMAYHLQRVIEFEHESGIAVLPLTDEGMEAYFTWLIERSPTWRSVRSARTAIRAWHIVARLPDPFLADVGRDMFLTGLKRTVTLWAKKKLAFPVEWVAAMIAGGFQCPKTPHHLALRDAAFLILGFFGFRRHSEVVLKLTGAAHADMGLRMCDVVFFPAERIVRLYIRRMKNDPYGKGHFVWLCDTTASGVPIYDLLAEYAASTGLPSDSTLAFIQGARYGGRFNGSQLYQYRVRLKQLMAWYLPFLTAEQRGDYSAHSLRRGGVTHAYRQDVHWDLLNVHGSWLGGTAIVGYREPGVDQLLRVTQCM